MTLCCFFHLMARYFPVSCSLFCPWCSKNCALNRFPNVRRIYKYLETSRWLKSINSKHISTELSIPLHYTKHYSLHSITRYLLKFIQIIVFQIAMQIQIHLHSYKSCCFQWFFGSSMRIQWNFCFSPTDSHNKANI